MLVLKLAGSTPSKLIILSLSLSLFAENDPSRAKQGRAHRGNSDLVMRSMNSAIYYIVAKIGNHFLRDIDILPLQGLAWQTNVVSIMNVINKFMFTVKIFDNNY